MMTDGLMLMLIGMGTVFIFLYLLVALMRLIALVMPRFDHLLPATEAPVSKSRPTSREAAQTGDEGAILAIAVAAAATRERHAS